jgi:cell division protein FtsQ
MILRRPREHGTKPKAREPRAAGSHERNRARNGRREAPPEEPGKVGGLRVGRVLLHAGKLAAGALITAAAIWGGIRAYGHATSAAYFAVDDVAVTGASRLDEQAVLETAGFARGMNVFRIDTEGMTRALEAHPWVLDATVRRRIPRSVSIEIRERRPEALVLFDLPYLIDDTGEIFKRWAPGDPVPQPIITGFSREQFLLDGDGVGESIREAIAFARRYRASGLERLAPLAELHREVDGGISAVVGGDPFTVRFGAGPYRQKLARLATLLDRMRHDGQQPAMIYFDNEVRPDRVTVKVKAGGRTSAGARVELEPPRGKIQSKI